MSEVTLKQLDWYNRGVILLMSVMNGRGVDKGSAERTVYDEWRNEGSLQEGGDGMSFVSKQSSGQVERYVVSEYNTVEKFAITHPYVYLIVGAVMGSTAWEYIEHTFGLK